jgi:hypothetical protein
VIIGAVAPAPAGIVAEVPETPALSIDRDPAAPVPA